MSLVRQSNEYVKNDIDFTTARSVLRGVYLVFQIVLGLGMLGGLIALVNGSVAAGLWALGSTAIAMLIVNLVYSFQIGFFELIKHAREIRNELVALRAKSGIAAPGPAPASTSSNVAGATRYDSSTHQYVRA